MAFGEPGDPGRTAVFLDRDGTIIEDRHYLSDPDGVVLLPGAARAIARLNRLSVPVLAVTNQSGIGRGYYGEADFRRVNDRMLHLLAEQGAELLDTFFCPHSPDQTPPCNCRKPSPGLFTAAAAAHDIDLATSFYVGDRMRDIQPGIDAGGTGYLIGEGEEGVVRRPEVVIVRDLAEAVEDLVQRRQND